ncbi:MAG: hypothetical protein WKF67_05740 [Rubrobacteraceae bacterium]
MVEVSVPQRLDVSRPVRLCVECEEPSGSVSAGTGRPLVFDKETERWLHVRCRTQADTLERLLSIQ